MDIKIIYLTNDTRRYAGMKNACLQLQDEMKISGQTGTIQRMELRLGTKAPGQQPGCGQVLQQYF